MSTASPHARGGLCFRRIEVRQFRRLSGPVVIDDLQPGLNLVAAPNESGKSTLVEALRAGLYERHSAGGKYVESWRPYGADGTSPEVLLEFHLNGVEYALYKRFLKGAKMTLTRQPGAPLEDMAAQEALNELLGASSSTRRRVSAELQGVGGLLWVDQGHAHEPIMISDGARSALQAALSGSMSAVLGGGIGQALLLRMSELNARYRTATGAAREPLKTAARAVAEAEQEQVRLNEQLTEHQSRLDALVADRKALAAHAAENTLSAALRRVQETAAARERAGAMERDLQQLEVQLKGALAAEALALNTVQGLERAASEFTALETRTAAAQEALDGQQAEIERLRTAAMESRRAHATAAAAAREARVAVTRADAAERHSNMVARERELSQRLASAESMQLERGEALAEAAKLALTREDLAGLRKLAQAQMRLAAQVEGTATRLLFDVAPGGDVRLSNGGERATQPLTGQRVVNATAPLMIEVPGQLTLRIEPGTSEAASPTQALADADAALLAALSVHGARDLKHAEALLGARERAVQRSAGIEAQLTLVAPHGLDALRAEVAAAKHEWNSVSDEERDTSAPRETAASRAERARKLRNAAESASLAADQADSEARSREAALGQARERLAADTARWQGHADRLAQLRAERVAAQDDTADAAASPRAELAQAANAVLTLQARVEAASAALAAHAPDALASDEQRAREALDGVQADIDQLRDRTARLEAALQAQGHEGLHEQRADADASLATAQRELARLTVESDAIAALHAALLSAHDQAQATLVAPIRARITHYLEQLMPGVQVEVGAALAPASLIRDSSDDFAALSVGAREQVAVITRLAYADLLVEQGQPVSVVLDDALVNSDDGRHEVMRTLLWDAAQRYQILLLTCHESRYRDLGARVHRLAG